MTIHKKYLALILGLALVLGALSGCQTPGSADPGASNSAGADPSGSGNQTIDPTAGDPSASGSPGADPGASPSPSAAPVPDIDLDAITDICVTAAGIPANTVLATVDGEEITAQEILFRVTSNADRLSNYFYIYYGLTQMPWDADLGGTTPRQFIKEDALNGAVLYHLVDRRAQAENIEVDQETLEDIQASLQASLDALETQQADKGGSRLYLSLSLIDPRLYAWYNQCEYLYSELSEKYYGVDSGSYPSDQTVVDYMEEDGWYSCKHILLATMDLTTREPLDEEAVAAKTALAEDILTQLRESDDPIALFDTLMNEYSEDTGLAYYPDGYMAQPGDMDPAFEEGALALEAGEISDIITGYYGYHIILRQAIDPAEYRGDYIEEQMVALRESWIEAADIQTTQAFDDLDVEAFYNALLDVRIAYEARYESES